MKVRLSKKIDENAGASQTSILHSFYNFINKKTLSSYSRSNFMKLENEDIDGVQDDITLHVDFTASLKGSHNDKLSDIELIIYIGEGPELTDTSIPCMTFSLDNLIDEKIELLDASIVSEDRVEILERLAIRLNDHSRQLKDALRRYHLNKKNASGKNSPLW